LHGLIYGAAADGDGLDFALFAHEFGEDGAGAAAEAVLDDDDVFGLEGLVDDVAELVVAGQTSGDGVAA
jgi:hypothetical protein